jgi:hypothetical protein
MKHLLILLFSTRWILISCAQEDNFKFSAPKIEINAKDRYTYVISAPSNGIHPKNLDPRITDLLTSKDILMDEMYSRTISLFEELIDPSKASNNQFQLKRLQELAYFILEFYLVGAKGQEAKVQNVLDYLIKIDEPEDLYQMAKAVRYIMPGLTQQLEKKYLTILKAGIKKYENFVSDPSKSAEFVQVHLTNAKQAKEVLYSQIE